jgi:hypothetical protein
MKPLALYLALAAASLAAPLAAAQTCPAMPQLARCAAAAPGVGQRVSGPVLQVIDGDTLCVALGPTPDQWVRVRLADGVAGVSRAQLMAAAFAHTVDCDVVRAEADGAVAVCAADGAPLAKAAAAVSPPPGDAGRVGPGLLARL